MSRTTEPDRRDPMAADRAPAPRPKPTLAQLGVDLAALEWQRSGTGDGAFEVAFVGRQADPGTAEARAGGDVPRPGQAPGTDWVLLRVSGDPAGRVLVYDRIEWACFLDGARRGEFDLGSHGGTGEPASN